MSRSKKRSTSRRSTRAPGSTRPAATSTFFSMYSRAFAFWRGCSVTAATDTSAAQTTQTAVANSTV